MLYATRAMEVIPMIEIFRRIGIPVERELLRAKLPVDIEAQPGGYISTIRGGRWSLNCLGISDVDDLGWHIYREHDQRRLSSTARRALNSCMSLHEQINCLLDSMRGETNYHQNLVYYGEAEIRIVFPNPISISRIETRISEWGRVLDVINLVRNSIGKTWAPRAIGFIAMGLPCEDAQAHLSATAFHGSQSATWVTVPAHILSAPAHPVTLVKPKDDAEAMDGSTLHGADLPTTLRAVLAPYLPAGRPPIDLAAEIAGMSRRTFQRRLSDHGLSYSKLLDQCAFNAARVLLADTTQSITDVALAVGYDDPSHFARAFRRISGMSPMQFRRSA